MITIPTILVSLLAGFGADLIGTLGAGSIFTTLAKMFARSAGTAAGKAAVNAATGQGRERTYRGDDAPAYLPPDQRPPHPGQVRGPAAQPQPVVPVQQVQTHNVIS